MPAPLDDADRSRIVYYSALGYSQRAISDAVGASRNTVRKYQRRAREAVESADDPTDTLVAIIEGRYDWERPERTDLSFGDHPM